MTKEHGTLTSVHPAWIASATDPGAVGAHKVWRDTSVTPNVYRERNDADNAWDDLGSFSTGAPLHVRFPFTFDTPGLDTGVVVPGWTPAVGDVVYQPWIQIDTAWDGVTPLGDVVFQGQPYGLLQTNCGVAVDMTAADYAGFGLSTNLAHPINSTGTISANLVVLRGFPGTVVAAVPLTIVVSRNGDPTGVQASATAYTPPTSPLVVVAGVNDEFVYTSVATGTPETFTVAPGTYTGVGAIAAAMAGALGGAAEQFQTLVDLTDDGSKIILTGKGWSSDNGDTITLGGNDVAVALGFTFNGAPSFFVSGAGGDPGATQGAAVLHLLVLRA